jgi:hypothetical protein
MPLIAQQEPMPLPRTPDCLVWYAGDPCDDQIQQYHQAIEQRQQQEWRNSALAPLQRQIADQQKQIADQQNQVKTLQLQVDSQTAEALQGQARNQAFVDGIGAILGAGLAFVVTVASFRRLANRSTPGHAPERAPSA